MPDYGPMYGMHVRFTAAPGRADELEAILLQAAEELRADEACRLYMISRSPADAETIWVTEAWTSRDAHAASLEDPAARVLIDRALPLMAGPPEADELRPSGGKGL